MDESLLDEDGVALGQETMAGTLPSLPRTSARPRPVSFTPEQRTMLLQYFEEYGMTSTHRRNFELMERCARDVGTTLERVKNWIGSEAVKRKRKAGILPRPKVEITGRSPDAKFITPPPSKKIKRVNGYNLFFSHCVRTNSNISSDFGERNAVVAQRWADLTEEERKQWAMKAEAACSSSAQSNLSSPQSTSQKVPAVSDMLSPPTTAIAPEISSECLLIEKTLLSIQEKLDLLEQVGFEGYAILVNTGELQTHLLATTKGKAYHKMKQQTGKPLENPLIGFVFSEDLESPSTSSLLVGGASMSVSPGKKLLSALSSVETMQKSVMNAFALKYKVATGRSEVPYNNLQSLGVQVYGMPPGIPFHSPLLYNQQQLQQILASLEKIVFLKVSPQMQQGLHESPASLADVDLATDSVASLVGSGRDLQIDEAGST